MEDLTVENNTATATEARVSRNRTIIRWIVMAVVLAAIVAAAMSVIGSFKLRTSEEEIYATNRIRVNTVIQTLEDGGAEQDELYQEYDEMYAAKLKNTKYYFARIDRATIDDRFARTAAEFAGMDSAAVIDTQGNVYSTWHCDYEFTRNRFNMLRSPGGDDRTTQPFNITGEDGVVRRFYGMEVAPGRILVFVQDWTKTQNTIGRMTSWGSILQHLVSVDTVSIAVSLNDYSYLYNPIDDLTGKDALQNGMEIEYLHDSYEGELTFGGEKWCAVGRQWNDAMVFVLTRATANIVDDGLLIGSISIVLTIFVLLVAAFGAIINRDNIRMGKMPHFISLIWRRNARGEKKGILNFNLDVAGKLLPIALIGVAAVAALSYYIQSLNALSSIAYEANWNTVRITDTLADNTESADVVNSEYKEMYLEKCTQIAEILEKNPYYVLIFNPDADNVHAQDVVRGDDGQVIAGLDSYGNPCWSISEQPFLRSLSELNDIEKITVFDENGRIMATNNKEWYFSVSDDPESQSYAFREILEDHQDVIAQDVSVDDEGSYRQYIGSVFHYYTVQNEDGSTAYVSLDDYNSQLAGTWEGSPILRHRGLVQISISPERLRAVTETASMYYVADHTTVHGTGFMTIFDDSDEHLCVYSRLADNIGKPAAGIGHSADAFDPSGESYNGIDTLQGTRYFQTLKLTGGDYIGVSVPLSTVYAGRAELALMVLAVVAVAMLAVFLWSCCFSAATEKLYEESTDAESGRVRNEQEPFLLTMPSGKTRRVRSAAARWDAEYIPWNSKTPDQKFAAVTKVVFHCFATFLFLCILLSRAGVIPIDAINYVYEGVWSKGVNIFAMTNCAITLIMVFEIAMVIEIVIENATSSMGSRAETLGHLLSSVVRYGVTLYAIFYVLYMCGLDTQSLIASAGILSLIVGLGAQSMIQDILAGLFIVFEGEFRVGDIVTVGDFRGNVLEIGLRTTKIEDPTKNIKVFNNSTLSGIINMTKEASYAAIDVGIEYGESLERVEAVLAAELPEVKKRLPAILDGPFYKGVSMLNNSSVDLKILAMCKEGDRIQLCRDLYRAVYLIFNKHNINVPFPQVTVSYLREDEEKSDEDNAKHEIDRTLDKLTEDEEDDEEDETPVDKA